MVMAAARAAATRVQARWRGYRERHPEISDKEFDSWLCGDSAHLLVPWRPPEIPLPTRGALRTLRGVPGAHRHERAAPPPTILRSYLSLVVAKPSPISGTPSTGMGNLPLRTRGRRGVIAAE